MLYDSTQIPRIVKCIEKNVELWLPALGRKEEWGGIINMHEFHFFFVRLKEF